MRRTRAARRRKIQAAKEYGLIALGILFGCGWAAMIHLLP